MPPALPCRCVLLLHVLPDGTSHFDWLTARSPDATDPLLTFRLGVRPDDPTVTAFTAERLPDHRALYLDYEGPLEPKDGADRGGVKRLTHGVAEIVSESADSVEIVANWGTGPQHYLGVPTEPGSWRFSVTPLDSDRR